MNDKENDIRGSLENASTGLWGQAIKSLKTQFRKPHIILQYVTLSKEVGVTEICQ